MATLVEMATEMVIARASSTNLTAEEMISELNRFHTALRKLEAGEEIPREEEAQAQAAPAISVKEAFKKNEVLCMICGKGFKTLGRHLVTAHGMKPREYRKQFGIKPNQPLSTKSLWESRRRSAIETGLAERLASAREARVGAKGEAGKPKRPAKAKTEPAAGAAPEAKPAPKAKPAKAAKP